MKDFLVILRRNFWQPIVVAIFILAAILLLLGERRDAWFISFVILFNTVFAVIQELRARAALRKLELLSAPRARRLQADGTTEDVFFEDLVAGDRIAIEAGDELPADGTLESHAGLEVDESILTGESASQVKESGDTLYAASVAVAGRGILMVTAVGAETKAGAMTANLKRYTPQITPLQRNIKRAITGLTFGALGLALLIALVYVLHGQDAVKIFKTITSAAVTVVPEGLLLASTLLLAFGSLRLAQAKVLPQKLAAIEAMALLDVLCVDKTGTLTSDVVAFERLEVFDKKDTLLPDLIAIAAHETASATTTSKSITEALPLPAAYTVEETLAFSSERKMSGARMTLGGTAHSILFGAPEYIAKLAPLSAAQKKQLTTLSAQGLRVLLIASFDDTKTSLREQPTAPGTVRGMLVLSNQLRSGVTKTVHYLQANDVSIRVISGDSPETVSYIAAQAGITNAANVLTGDDLAALTTDAEWRAAASETIVFARVLPEQKERLIATFRELGNFTGMVGDGVNDALALKKADLGVAMFAGAAATRRVADIVLLNNSFNSLPVGMRLGNRIMQAIEMIATLFFHKIIYGTLLLLLTMAMGIVYPFEPRHVTFMNIFLVTMPTLMWTLFPPLPRQRLSPAFFWRDTLGAVWPIALMSGLTVTLTYAVLQALHPGDPTGVATTTTLIATFFGVYLVFLMQRMFMTVNNRRARLARRIYLAAVIVIAISSFGFGFTRDFFTFSAPVWQQAWPLLGLLVVVIASQWYLATQAGKRLQARHRPQKDT